MSEINGSALSLDPGEHTFVFDAAGSEPLTKTLMLREGEKDRRELITLRATPTHTPPPAELVTRKRSTAVRAVGVGLVGLGVVGVGLGTFFGLRARSSWSSSQAECSTARACTIGQHDQAVEDHDDASTMATLSTIAFAAGGVALAGGAVVFFAAPVVTPKSAGLSAVIRF